MQYTWGPIETYGKMILILNGIAHNGKSCTVATKVIFTHKTHYWSFERTTVVLHAKRHLQIQSVGSTLWGASQPPSWSWCTPWFKSWSANIHVNDQLWYRPQMWHMQNHIYRWERLYWVTLHKHWDLIWNMSFLWYGWKSKFVSYFWDRWPKEVLILKDLWDLKIGWK